MFKYIAILALSLCACSNSVSNAPMTVELHYQEMARAVRCTDDLDCLLKLRGACPNGYNNAHMLEAEGGKRVAVVYSCASAEDKAVYER